MILSAGAIAELIGGITEGDPTVELSSVGSIEHGSEGDLTFLANPQYTRFIYRTKASAVIVQKELKLEKPVTATLIRVADPYLSFSALLKKFDPANIIEPGIHASSVVDASVKLGKDVCVQAGAVISKGAELGDNVIIGSQCFVGANVRIGAQSRMHPGSKVLQGCIIGKKCTLHAGVVIGSDGFGFAPDSGSFSKIPQIGNVIIEDDVEIGANTTVDRATLGSTIIRHGVKLDNLIQVAHNVEIGANTVIAAQTGIAGSAQIGENCMIGGQVGIVGHLVICNNVMIAAQSGIGSSLPDGAVVQGSPAFNAGNYRRSYVTFRNLPGIVKDIENQLRDLTEQ